MVRIAQSKRCILRNLQLSWLLLPLVTHTKVRQRVESSADITTKPSYFTASRCKRSSALSRLNSKAVDSHRAWSGRCGLLRVFATAPEVQSAFVSVYNRMRTSPLEWAECLLNKETRWVCCQHTQIISSIDERRPTFHKRSATSPHPLLHKTSVANDASLEYFSYSRSKCRLLKHISERNFVFFIYMNVSSDKFKIWNMKRRQHCCWVTAQPRVAPDFIRAVFHLAGLLDQRRQVVVWIRISSLGNYF